MIIQIYGRNTENEKIHVIIWKNYKGTAKLQTYRISPLDENRKSL